MAEHQIKLIYQNESSSLKHHEGMENYILKLNGEIIAISKESMKRLGKESGLIDAIKKLAIQ